jgi:RimJ/RimL family protein N-acetyltransferase
MPNYTKLTGEKVYLSPVCADDWELYNKWGNDFEVTSNYGGGTHVYPVVTGYANLQERARNRNTFTIVDKATDAVIGECGFNDEDIENRYAKIGITIGEKDYWSKGYGQDAMRLLLDFGFNVRGYNSICLNVYEFNKRGIACYEKVGFKQQGVWRDCIKRGEKRYDCIYMDILASEYFADESNRKGL